MQQAVQLCDGHFSLAVNWVKLVTARFWHLYLFVDGRSLLGISHDKHASMHENISHMQLPKTVAMICVTLMNPPSPHIPLTLLMKLKMDLCIHTDVYITCNIKKSVYRCCHTVINIMLQTLLSRGATMKNHIILNFVWCVINFSQLILFWKS